jgi:hypothetical protein
MDTTVTTTGLIKFDPAHPPKQLTQKLAKIAEAVGLVPKTGWNKHFNYPFLKEADLTEALRKHLCAANIMPYVGSAIMGRERIADSRSGAAKYLTDVLVEVTFSDGDTGEWITMSGVGTGEDGSDKGTYKGITGGLKYILMKTFLIYTGDDPENPAEAEEAAQAKKGKSKNQTSTQAPAKSDQRGVVCAECNKAIANVKTKNETFTASQWAQKTKKAFGQVLCLEHTKGKKPLSKVETTETDSGDGFRLLRGVLKTIDDRKTTRSVKDKKTGVSKKVESKYLLLTMDNGIQVSNWHQSQFDILRKAVGKIVEMTVKLEQKGDITYRNCEWTVKADGVWYVPGTDGKPIKAEERSLQVDDDDAPNDYDPVSEQDIVERY